MGLIELLSGESKEPKETKKGKSGKAVVSDEEALAKYYRQMNEESRQVLKNPYDPSSRFKSSKRQGEDDGHREAVNGGVRALNRKKWSLFKNKNKSSDED